jgi:myo-inositol-1(or 4)-monophosphatase
VNDLTRLAEPVEAAMRATRAEVLRAWRAVAEPEEFKADGTAVTDLDRTLEKQLAAALLPLDGAYGLVSEESGPLREGNPTWHLDPVDGTANFARRVAVFGSQVALVDGIEPLFAAVYHPLVDEFTWAARGAGTWNEGRRVAMPDRPPKHALIDIDVARSGLFSEHPELVARIRRGCYRVRAMGSVAVHLRDVATGAADAYLGSRKKVSPMHDMAPGVLLVREAGGAVSDGAGCDPLVERRRLVAGSPRVHDWLCELIASA